MERARLAPGVPADYYRAIAERELEHWWHRGMLAITAALLEDRVTPPVRLLDAGCGTGGFLRWALDRGLAASAAGIDLAPAAIELARERVPEAELAVAPLSAVPFADESFGLVTVNDVLQHVPEDELETSLRELVRVLRPEGTLLVRTNGASRFRQERDDWRAFDRAALVGLLARAGLRVERVTYANSLLSLAAAARGRTPRAPSEERHGIPPPPTRLGTAVGGALLALEARVLARAPSALPYGHTLFAIARSGDRR